MSQIDLHAGSSLESHVVEARFRNPADLEDCTVIVRADGRLLELIDELETEVRRRVMEGMRDEHSAADA